MVVHSILSIVLKKPVFKPKYVVEILVPDFRGRMDIALRIMTECPPDVFNHNIETVPRLYKAMRPGSDYQHSLTC